MEKHFDEEWKMVRKVGPVVSELSLRERWHETPQVIIFYLITTVLLCASMVYFFLRMIQYPNALTWWYAFWVTASLDYIIFRTIFDSHWRWERKSNNEMDD